MSGPLRGGGIFLTHTVVCTVAETASLTTKSTLSVSTGTKHPAFSTNHLADTNKTKLQQSGTTKYADLKLMIM